MNQYELCYKGSCYWKNVDIEMLKPFTNVELVKVYCDESEHQLFIKLIILSDTRANAESTGNRYVGEMLDRFTFVCEQNFREPELQKSTDDAGRVLTLASSDINGSCTAVHTMTAQQKQDIEDRILNSQSIYYSLFRAALKQGDVVAKYMFLYSVILKIFEDKQIQVDRFIIDNGFKGQTSPRRNYSTPETVFTIIRNNVGHTGRIASLDIEKNRKDMQSNINELIKYVKLAIINVL